MKLPGRVDAYSLKKEKRGGSRSKGKTTPVPKAAAKPVKRGVRKPPPPEEPKPATPKKRVVPKSKATGKKETPGRPGKNHSGTDRSKLKPIAVGKTQAGVKYKGRGPNKAKDAKKRKEKEYRPPREEFASDILSEHLIPDPIALAKEYQRNLAAAQKKKSSGDNFREPTDAEIRILVNWVRSGNAPEVAARVIGINYEGFRKLLEQGKLDPLGRAALMIHALDIADAQSEAVSVQLNTAGVAYGKNLQWHLERRYPQRWGPKTQALLQGIFSMLPNTDPKFAQTEDRAINTLMVMQTLGMIQGPPDDDDDGEAEDSGNSGDPQPIDANAA